MEIKSLGMGNRFQGEVMTCKQFADLTERDPVTTTTAEAAAFYRHTQECTACRIMIEGSVRIDTRSEADIREHDRQINEHVERTLEDEEAWK